MREYKVMNNIRQEYEEAPVRPSPGFNGYLVNYIVDHYTNQLEKYRSKSIDGKRAELVGGKLVGLDLSYLGIQGISPWLFTDFPQIQYLHLGYNSFDNYKIIEKNDNDELPEDHVIERPMKGHFPVINLANLQILRLNHCKLSRFPSDLIAGVPNLSRIDLQYNMIKYIPNDLFHTHPRLEYLDINSNHLHEIPPTLIEYASQLKYVNYTGNLIELGSAINGAYFNFEKISRYVKIDQELKSIEGISYQLLSSYRPINGIFLKIEKKLCKDDYIKIINLLTTIIKENLFGEKQYEEIQTFKITDTANTNFYHMNTQLHEVFNDVRIQGSSFQSMDPLPKESTISQLLINDCPDLEVVLDIDWEYKLQNIGMNNLKRVSISGTGGNIRHLDITNTDLELCGTSIFDDNGVTGLSIVDTNIKTIEHMVFYRLSCKAIRLYRITNAIEILSKLTEITKCRILNISHISLSELPHELASVADRFGQIQIWNSEVGKIKKFKAQLRLLRNRPNFVYRSKLF